MEKLQLTDILSIVSILFSLFAVLVAVWAVYQTYKNDKKVVYFEKRMELYSELSFYLQLLLSDHNLINDYEQKVFELISKSYIFSSPFVYDYFKKFLSSLDNEKASLKDKRRDKSFNEFDANIDILLKAMKKELDKQGDVSEKDMKLEIESAQFNIGNYYLQEAANETSI